MSTECVFSVDGETANLSLFAPQNAATQITFSGSGAIPTVPSTTVSGDFATFNNVSGGLGDSGFSPSDATKTKVAMVSGATVVNNFAKFSDVHGTVADAGARIIANTTATYAGGGTSNAFVATGLSALSHGSCVIRTSTNPVVITSAVPSTNTLTVTFSADPGAATTVDYLYATAALS
jgi:hypothetical protein